eukprot:7309123-Pyramimonas_sp.AAC.1
MGFCASRKAFDFLCARACVGAWWLAYMEVGPGSCHLDVVWDWRSDRGADLRGGPRRWTSEKC